MAEDAEVIRQLTPTERQIASRRYQEASVATGMWTETIDLLTGGDRELAINTQTWTIVRPTKKEEE